MTCCQILFSKRFKKSLKFLLLTILFSCLRVNINMSSSHLYIFFFTFHLNEFVDKWIGSSRQFVRELVVCKSKLGHSRGGGTHVQWEGELFYICLHFPTRLCNLARLNIHSDILDSISSRKILKRFVEKTQGFCILEAVLLKIFIIFFKTSFCKFLF